METEVPLLSILAMMASVMVAGYNEHSNGSRVGVLLHLLAAAICGAEAVLLSKGILPL